MDNNTRQAGVYIIELDNGWYYVGSALDLTYRKSRHLSDLRCQRHPNKHMQRRWNKHGQYTFTAAEYCHPDDLRRIEQRYLTRHYGKPLCLNISKDATAPNAGMKTSAETKAKRAATIKATPPPPPNELSRQLMSHARTQYWANKPRPTKRSHKRMTPIERTLRKLIKTEAGQAHDNLIQQLAQQLHSKR